jgi:hypothetical protein
LRKWSKIQLGRSIRRGGNPMEIRETFEEEGAWEGVEEDGKRRINR